jgi:hypothetical protein
MITKSLAMLANVSSPLTFRGHYQISDEGNARLLTIRDLASKDPFTPENLLLVHAEKPASKITIRQGDILMPARGLSYPAILVGITHETLLPTGQIHIIRCQSIHPEYLLWYLNRKKTQDQIAMQLTGSTIQSLKKSDLERIEIEVPAQEIQIMIGQLDQLRQQREHARRALEKIELQEMEVVCQMAIYQ